MKIRLRWVALAAAMALALAPAGAALAHGGSSSGGGGDETSFSGVIESLPATPGFLGDWLISGTTVHVSDATELDANDGTFELGASVDVEGTTETDGSITASQIETTEASDDDAFGEVEFYGTVDSLPPDMLGDWVVSGRVVHVTELTQIDTEHGMPAEGTPVEVKGLAESDGSITASEISVEDHATEDEGTVDMSGSLASRPAHVFGTWRVSHHPVRVTTRTRIVRNGHRLHAGSKLRVIGHWRKDGSVVARRIVVRT